MTVPKNCFADEIRRILALPQPEWTSAVKSALDAFAGDAVAVREWQNALIAHLSSAALGTVVFPLAGLRKFYAEHEDVMRAAFSSEDLRCLGVAQEVLANELAKAACLHTFDVRFARYMDQALRDFSNGEPSWLSDIARAIRDPSGDVN